MENLTEEQLEQALETIISDLNKTTIVDNNGNNHINIGAELTENENNEQPIRRFTRIRSANPLVRLGKPGLPSLTNGLADLILVGPKRH